MNSSTGSGWARASLLAALTLAATMGYSCGGAPSDESKGGPGSGGDGGLVEPPTGSGGSGDAGGDTCNGRPCANHSGDHSFFEEGVSNDAANRFVKGTEQPEGTDAGREPVIGYPSHETMFPINVSRILHEWSAGAGELYELSFVGPNTNVRVYTLETSWLPSEEQWQWIAESNRGSEVTFTVRAVDESDRIWRSASITLYFSPTEVQGAIYYWSTGTAGVMKGLVSSPFPEKFYTDPAAEDSDTCVACHTLSRDGKRLAVGYGGEKLRSVTVPERDLVLPAGDEKERASAWTTFSPDGQLLLVASKGALTLIDADTGEPVGPNEGLVPLPDGTVATHPDWNATGDKVAITLGKKGGDKNVEGGSIALLPYNSGNWGEPDVLVPHDGSSLNHFYPVWSPDGAWLAFVTATGKSKDNPSAVLRLVKSSGGTPIELVRLNERVGKDDGVTDVGNTMPTWAPASRAGVFWLAFSSLRAYASVRPQHKDEDQIWIAAIDPNLDDPGYAAFWAPFQSTEEGNHRAFWTRNDGDTDCGCVEICGDGIDNDCDGVADGPDCVQCAATEICGNGIDDDCNCVVDDCTKACDPDVETCVIIR